MQLTKKRGRRVKTSVSIPEGVLARAKALAAERDVSVSRYVTTLVVRDLDARDREPLRVPEELP